MSEDTSKFALKDSLCWHCSRSTDSTCAWSEKFEPVDGWDAEKSIIKGHYGKDSYFVNKCPMFAQYESDKRDDIGYRKLSDAVMARAGQDYLKLMRHEKRLRDKDVGLSTKRSVYGDWHQRNKEPVRYHKVTGDTWKTLYNFEPFNMEIIALEHFFKSEYAEMFDESVNPVYIMESIQRQVGITHESV